MSNASNKTIFKTFGLTSWALKNATTVLVFTVLVSIAGILSYLSLPREALPDVAAPEVFITTQYPGNSAEDIENLITRPLEKKLKKISGIDKITSTSQAGFSAIDVKFTFDVDPDQALREVKDKIDEATSDRHFPQDLPAKPHAVKLDFSELRPILNINLSGEFSTDDLKDYAEYLQDKIEQLPEISTADIRGLQDREVEVAIDLVAMVAHNVSFRNIIQAVQNENMTISAGDLKEGGIRRTVRVVGEIKSPRELERIVVKRARGKVTYLRDIATVRFQDKEPESFARQFGRPVVMLDVKKRRGANQIIAADKIKEIIEAAQKEYFPPSLRVNITNDMSDRTRQQVADLENNIISGVILVVLVLMFFMGFRNSLFVGVAIPLSMVISFLVLGAMGATLNMMVLFSLILALGMLVDNGIVIIENIYRYREEGYGAFEAARYGVGEVAWPIITSTATTLAAFLPLAMWPGIIGEFMKFLPITLIIVLLSSLFVALIINPVFALRFMRLAQDEEADEADRPRLRLWWITAAVGLGILSLRWMFFGADSSLFLRRLTTAVGVLTMVTGLSVAAYHLLIRPAIQWFLRSGLPFIERHYEATLRFALKDKHPRWFFGGTVLLLFISAALLKAFPPPVSFFPRTHPDQIYVYIEFPVGTDITVTDSFTYQIYQRIHQYFVDRHLDTVVTSIIEQVGAGTGDPRKGPMAGKTPHRAKIVIDFHKKKDEWGINTSAILDDIRQIVGHYAGIKITVDKNQMRPPMGLPINIELVGDDYDQLLQTALAVRDFINRSHIPGIENLVLDVDKNKPELTLTVDREKAGRLGINTAQVGDALRTALYGKEADRYKQGEDDYPINVRLQRAYRYDRQQLLNLPIVFRNQETGKLVTVPISTVISQHPNVAFSAIKRKNLTRVINISSNVLEGYRAPEVARAVDAKLKEYPFPEGISYRMTGEQEELQKNFSFLSRALMIAVFLIFLILVSEFNSLKQPFIILSTVVLSLIGVLLGLVIFQMDFIVVMTMIGIIALAGIVVNNAIVLIDYANLTIDRLRLQAHLKEEEPTPYRLLYEGVVIAGKTRLRPVILTAVTTIFGMVPLALGMNIDFVGLVTELDPHFYIGGSSVAFWGPLARAVIFGLTFATFLTLVIVPAMYMMWGKRR